MNHTDVSRAKVTVLLFIDVAKTVAYCLRIPSCLVHKPVFVVMS